MELFWSISADMEFSNYLTTNDLILMEKGHSYIYVDKSDRKFIFSIIMLINRHKLINLNNVPNSYKKINKSSILVCKLKDYKHWQQHCDCCNNKSRDLYMLRRSSSYWCFVDETCANKMVTIANKYITKDIVEDYNKFLLISPFIIKDVESTIKQYYILTYQ